jgi:hypothetical protein
VIILQVNALLETLELKDSAQRKGQFAQYNCLVLGHTKYQSLVTCTTTLKNACTITLSRLIFFCVVVILLDIPLLSSKVFLAKLALVAMMSCSKPNWA